MLFWRGGSGNFGLVRRDSSSIAAIAHLFTWSRHSQTLVSNLISVFGTRSRPETRRIPVLAGEQTRRTQSQHSATMVSAPRRHKAEPEGHPVEHPFSIEIVDPKGKEQRKKKRRHTENGEEDDATQRIMLQISPFAPCGKFGTHEKMDVSYHICPREEWISMPRYKSFIRKFNRFYYTLSPRVHIKLIILLVHCIT